MPLRITPTSLRLLQIYSPLRYQLPRPASHLHIAPSRQSTSTRLQLARIPYATMTAITDSDIIKRLEALSISNPEVIEHAPVKGGAEWKAELDKAGKGGISLTKTVSKCASPCPLRILLRDRSYGRQREVRPTSLTLSRPCSSCSSPKPPNQPPQPPSSCSLPNPPTHPPQLWHRI